VPRAHRNKIAVNIVQIVIHKSLIIGRGMGIITNNSLVIKDIKIIFMYSAIKIAANTPPLYSVLNPDTSSDSPSAKSKGVRFVSARQEVNHIRRSGGHKIQIIIVLLFIISTKFMDK
jgi:hypothetical protein